MAKKSDLFELFLMAYANFQLGAVVTVVGPTIADLQCLFHANLGEVSGLLMSFGLSSCVSGVLFTFLIKRCNIYLLLATMTLLENLGVAMVAATPFLSIGHVMFVINGFSSGFVISGAYFLCSRLFAEEAYAFHTVACGGAAGAVLSPILSKPFLGTVILNVTDLQQNSTLTNYTSAVKLHQKETTEKIANTSVSFETTIPSYCSSVSSNINHLYMIIGFSGLPLTVAFFIYFCRNGSGDNWSITNNYTKQDSIPIQYARLFTVFIIFSTTIAFGIAYTFGTYLTVVGIEGSLHLEVQQMALMTSLFWFSYFVGRLAGTLLSPFMSQIMALYIFILGEILTTACLTVSFNTEWPLWMFSLSLGFLSGPVPAALMTWSRDYITLSAFLSGMLTLADILGTSLLPFFCGQLINYFGLKSFNYYCLALALLQFAVLCGMHGFGRLTKFSSEIKPT